MSTFQPRRLATLVRPIGAITLVTLGTLGLGQGAKAQFPGDVFFDDPALIVEAGRTATFEVHTFTGTQALGAITLALDFDPTSLQIVSVTIGEGVELQRFFATGRRTDEPGTVRFGALNDASQTRPFGSISLAKIEVKPLIRAGKSTEVKLRVLAMRDTETVAFARPRGFSGRLTVVSKNSPSPDQERSVGPPPPSLRAWCDALVRRLLPVGGELEVLIFDGKALRQRWVRVATKRRGGPSDSPGVPAPRGSAGRR